MALDIGTVLFTTGIIGLVLVLFAWTLALTPRAPQWRLDWAWGNTSILLGVVLFLGQGSISPWVSVVLANGMVIFGYHLLELSLRRFAARRFQRWAIVVIATTFAVGFGVFTFVWNLYEARVVVYSTLVVAVWVRILTLLRALPEYRNHRTLVRSFMILAAFILLAHLGRAVIAVGEHGQNLLAPSQALALMLLVSVIVMVAWSLGLITLELVRSKRHLEDALETRDRMMQLIAHDLRGPLGGQVGLLELMKSQGRCRDDEDTLELLSVSAQNSYDLLENLLDWAQSQRGTLTLSPEALEVTDLLHRATEPYTTTAHAKGVSLTVEAPPATIRVDRRTVATILRNLVSNAVKFTPAGGSVVLSGSLTPSGAVFRVKDTGSGLSAEQLQSFHDGVALRPTTGTGLEEGSGLGLTLCRDFARLNGATLTLESGPQGTTAVLTIPQEGT